MRTPGDRNRRRTQSGQVLVLVALGMVAMIGMVGLVLDGGSTFGQRRSEQRGADLAALAGANDLLLNNNVTTAEATARQVARDNGYDDAVVSVNVTVTPYQQGGGAVKVDVVAPHQNSFSNMFGMNSWAVGVSGTAIAGRTTTATGMGPMIFSVNDFQANGMPEPAYTQTGCGAGGCPFGTVNGDAPSVGGNDLAWTNFGVGNVDTNQVSDIITGQSVITGDAGLNDYIGQYNNGFHNALFQDVQQYLAGKDVLVPITTEQVPGITDGPGSCGGGLAAGGGCFQGWAIFHVVAAIGGSDKHIYGYFVPQEFTSGGTVEDCASSACPRFFGSYSLYLAQ